MDPRTCSGPTRRAAPSPSRYPRPAPAQSPTWVTPPLRSSHRSNIVLRCGWGPRGSHPRLEVTAVTAHPVQYVSRHADPADRGDSRTDSQGTDAPSDAREHALALL